MELREWAMDRLEKVRKGCRRALAARQPGDLAASLTWLRQLEGNCRGWLPAGLREEVMAIFAGLGQAMTQEILQQDRQSLPEACALMEDILDALRARIKEEPLLAREGQPRKEVVFLPYKAEMWDSLESIWREAEADERCNAYVMPLPYADRNPDGSVKSWHCDAPRFPADVPVIDYRLLDLAALHPDAIFIHNPYDDCNLVTSVAEDYYSDKLKEQTDLLVYVPYFVRERELHELQYQYPGVINADKVIVWSEEVKQDFEANYPGGHPPKGKFLALGSPKLDKVRVARREEYALPEDWRRILRDRKAILYNTTLTSFLLGEDAYLDKVEDVLRFFKGQDDAAFWWRPHPLFMSTIDSMRPELAGRYRTVVARYRSEGWGIYDDTPELDRAIAWTDAYYGDSSSLVPLVQAVGRPVLLQCVDGI